MTPRVTQPLGLVLPNMVLLSLPADFSSAATSLPNSSATNGEEVGLGEHGRAAAALAEVGFCPPPASARLLGASLGRCGWDGTD